MAEWSVGALVQMSSPLHGATAHLQTYSKPAVRKGSAAQASPSKGPERTEEMGNNGERERRESSQRWSIYSVIVTRTRCAIQMRFDAHKAVAISLLSSMLYLRATGERIQRHWLMQKSARGGGGPTRRQPALPSERVRPAT
jgi:hypothetical protein